jgi:hypothetical protein
MVRRASYASIEIIMDKNFSHLLQLGRRGAERRCGELINELSFLFTSFPHLSDAFDADGLALSFIIKRDARDASAKTSRRTQVRSDGGDDPSCPPPQERRHHAPSRRLTGSIGSRVGGRDRD